MSRPSPSKCKVDQDVPIVVLADELNDIIKGLAVFDPLLKQIDDHNARNCSTYFLN